MAKIITRHPHLSQVHAFNSIIGIKTHSPPSEDTKDAIVTLNNGIEQSVARQVPK